MAIQKLSPKDPAETVLVSFDFSNVLTDTTEVLTSVSWTASVAVGIDLNPSAILTGIPFMGVSNTVVYITGGIDGVTYTITVVALTSKAQTLKLAGTIKVEIQK